MEKSRKLEQTSCLNCGTPVEGAFCSHCGQHIRDNSDRSLSRLMGEVFGNIFFFDNRFFLSMRYLFRRPGLMTVEFLTGKRKKFLSPVTLFLFVNLIYFIVNPLTDYSISLYDQTYSQPYSKWAKGWVDLKLQEKELDEQAYSVIYQNASDNISKSIMIINVPMIALFIYLMVFKRRPFYYDSLIFSFHFFSLFMVSWILLDWVYTSIDFLSGEYSSQFLTVTFFLFTFMIPLIYAILSVRKFMGIRWYWAIPAGVWVLGAVLLANLFYRFIILVLTLWFT